MNDANKNIKIDGKVSDLIAKMTLEEKVGQLLMTGPDTGIEWAIEHHIGTFINASGELAGEFQKKSLEAHRLKIPVLISLDCTHGNAMYPGGAVLPVQLALACSWNRALLKKSGELTAREMLATGVNWTYAPVLDVAKDLRWGRVDETFGEDQFLVATLGVELIKGLQGDSLAAPTSVLACGKHFIGYSETIGGRDSSECVLSKRQLKAHFLYPYKEAFKNGLKTVMAGYHAIDGAPCSANRWLLHTLLREECGFDGFVVSDWNNTGRLVDEHKITDSTVEAAAMTVNSGNDLAMAKSEFFEDMLIAVKNGLVDEETVNRSCARILKVKFELGLFDDDQAVNNHISDELLSDDDAQKTAEDAARETIVLLENKNKFLPLNENVRNILVVGPNADDVLTLLGNWSLGCDNPADWHRGKVHPRGKLVTFLDGLKSFEKEGYAIQYVKACDVQGEEESDLASALFKARDADVVLAFVGDDMDLVGEGHDRADIRLTGDQQLLLDALYDCGTPVVVICNSTKPLIIEGVQDKAAAFVLALSPGMKGGNALADILFGKVNPSGKLPVSVPHNINQQPVYYDQTPNWHGGKRYVDLKYENNDPMYAFGYGLSYTEFQYSNLNVKNDRLNEGESLMASVDVENTGERAGREIVQLYISDLIASVSQPVKRLKGFDKIDLEKGEKKTVCFEIPYEELAIIDREENWVVEPGEFEVLVGGSSMARDLISDRFWVV